MSMLLGILLRGGRPVVYDVWGSSPSDDLERSDDGRVGVQYKTDGTIFIQDTVGTSESYSDSGRLWVDPVIVASNKDHWIRCTHNSGTTSPSGDSVGSWLQLNVDRDWYIIGSSGVIINSNNTFEIATDSGGSNIVATANLAFELDDT